MSAVNNLQSSICISYYHCKLFKTNNFRDFLRSKRKLWKFTSVDLMAQQKGSREKIIIIFIDKIKTSELTPELKTYRRLNLCIEPMENIEKLASKIRYEFNCNHPEMFETISLHKIQFIFSKGHLCRVTGWLLSTNW